jgi:tRNA-2-methylthio-N6-dimethylallyladenosine synthase
MSTIRTESKQAASDPTPGTGRVHVVTFGCQMNKYDSQLVEGRFRRKGWSTTDSLEDADVVLFNTCSVRDHAEERTMSWVGELKRLKKERPELVVGVMGCMAQRMGEEIFQRAGHVDLVAGTRQFAQLPTLVDEVRRRRAGGERQVRLTALSMDDRLLLDRDDEPYDGGVHAYLTVMRGCDLNCTYCIVPTVRGRVLSYPIDTVVKEARHYVAQGAKVLTLLGQTVNSWGEDLPAPAAGEKQWSGRQGRPGLGDLLRELQLIEGLERIRLITLHPSYITENFARAIAECDKVERFLPLPAQSGSDEILRAMKRGYTTDLYRKRVEILRTHVPDIELGSDWIVGFPGESDADHEKSEAFLREMGFLVNYIFKYDPRPGTKAHDGLEDSIPDEVKKERNQRMLKLGEELGLLRHGAHVGQTRRVLVEGVRDDGRLSGRTVHGMVASFEGPAELVGTQVDVCIEGASGYGMSGVLAKR